MKGKLRYGNTVIPYCIIQTKRKKTLHIFVEKDTVEVRAPESKNVDEIIQLIENKASWIFNSRLRLKDRKTDIIQSKNSLLYLGKNVPYSIHTMEKNDKIILKNSSFQIYIKSKSVNHTKIKELYQNWLVLKYSTYIERRIGDFSKILNVKPKGFQIKILKSKWGSATISTNIHLNLHLLKTPRKMIDYIILHEMTHLKIKGHRHEFWACLEGVMPDYKERKAWLDRNYLEILKD